jgi:ClpP class serine protease
MGISEILWLFFMFSAIQPVIQQKMLEASRLRLLRRFERSRKSRAIALVHRQETMSFLGFPVMRYIDVNDSEDVLRAIKLTGPRLSHRPRSSTRRAASCWPRVRSPTRCGATGRR